jgi:DNA-binding transcriptional LysR family regulator
MTTELRHWRCFVAVAEESDLRLASERICVTHEAFREQILKLARDLAVGPPNRTGRSVTPTTAGRALLSKVRGVLRQTEIARSGARNARDHITSRLRRGKASLSTNVQRLAVTIPLLETSLEPEPVRELSATVHAQW